MDHPIPSVQRIPAAGQLPPEIWIEIIKNEAEDVDFTSMGYRPQTHWKACSLVCRHWRDMTLPYLFRLVRITGPQYVRFFTENPSIARLVQHLHFGHYSVDINLLDDLLGCLHNARSVRLLAVGLGPRDVEELQVIYRNYKLEALYCYLTGSIDPYWRLRILKLLALFSKIKLLELSVDDSGSSGAPRDLPLSAVDATPTLYRSRPEIHSLYLDCGAYTHSFIPPFLLEVGALSQLTKLSLDIFDPLKVLIHVDQLLCSVGPKLRALRVALLADGEWSGDFGSATSSRELLIDKLHQGLNACAVLEDFSLTTTVFATDISQCRREWLRVVEIVTLLPPLHLRRLQMDVAFETGVQNVVHPLSWSSLQAACRRFVNLSSLELMVYVNAADEFTGPDDTFPCIRFEMQDFQRLLLRPSGKTSPWACDQPDCVRYNTGGSLDDARLVKS